MQRSGGCAPLAVSAPRAMSRTHAAAGVAVEMTDPPRPKWGRVIARAVTALAVAPGDPHEVDRDGLVRRRGGLARGGRHLLGGRLCEVLEPGQQRRRQRQAEAGPPAAEALAEGGELRVQGVDRLTGADRIAVVDDPAGTERLDLLRSGGLQHDRLERELVDQRLNRVRRAHSPVGGRRRVAPGREDVDRVGSLSEPPDRLGRHQVGLARARPDAEHREPPGPLELARELELAQCHPVQTAQVEVVAARRDARPHRLQVDSVGGGVEQDIRITQSFRERVDVARVDARGGRLAGAVHLRHRAGLP